MPCDDALLNPMKNTLDYHKHLKKNVPVSSCKRTYIYCTRTSTYIIIKVIYIIIEVQYIEK